MIGDFSAGLGYVVRGLRGLGRPGLRRYAAVPLLVNAVLFSAALLWAGGLVAEAVAWSQAQLPAYLDWLAVLLWPLFALLGLGVLFYGFALVANLIGAPFNGRLAARVEDLAAAQPVVRPEIPLWREVGMALTGELRKLGYYLLWAAPLLLLSLIPVLNLAAAPLWLLFGAWMFALQYLDYPMGNHGIGFAAQRPRLAARRALALGFGTGVALLTLTPLLNLLAMPAAVIGASLLWHERLYDGNHQD